MPCTLLPDVAALRPPFPFSEALPPVRNQSAAKVCQALLDRHPDLTHQDLSGISGSNADPFERRCSAVGRKTPMAIHHSSWAVRHGLAGATQLLIRTQVENVESQ